MRPGFRSGLAESRPCPDRQIELCLRHGARQRDLLGDRRGLLAADIIVRLDEQQRFGLAWMVGEPVEDLD